MANVLIVDRDDVVRAILLELLSESYDCNAAGTAEAALQYLEIQNYDAVLTDISMLGLTGVELLKRIQLKDLRPRVILISGNGDEGAESLRKLGAFAYLHKPFSLEEIEHIIERAVESNRSACEMRQQKAPTF